MLGLAGCCNYGPILEQNSLFHKKMDTHNWKLRAIFECMSKIVSNPYGQIRSGRDQHVGDIIIIRGDISASTTAASSLTRAPTDPKPCKLAYVGAGAPKMWGLTEAPRMRYLTPAGSLL